MISLAAAALSSERGVIDRPVLSFRTATDSMPIDLSRIVRVVVSMHDDSRQNVARAHTACVGALLAGESEIGIPMLQR